MCGLLAIAVPNGSEPSLSDAQLARCRDTMSHRGPDGSGILRRGPVALAHRRLAVLDPTPNAAQPMTTPDGRYSIVYNGELYNEPELRAALEAEGIRLRSSGDTETLLHALAVWGADAAGRLRGMYSFAFVDHLRHRLLLARDPMGIKPLYLHRAPDLLIAASDPLAILAHPDVSAEPDRAAIRAYLTSVRPVVGERTMFRGIHAAPPGAWISVDLSDPAIPESVRTVRPAEHAPGSGECRAIVEESVRLHRRSDVPQCVLLSGGLDSSIIAMLAAGMSDGPIQTFASGALGGEDLPHARAMADRLGADHTLAGVDRALFLERWPEIVRRTGLPLSTPNEVAINEVARTLRARGNVVALSGEGADELFGGYDVPMCQAWAHAEGDPAWPADPGAFHVASNTWIPGKASPALLNPDMLGDPDELTLAYEAEFAALEREIPDSPDRRIQAHLRFHRRVNLVNLLRRLDSATMLESVEGRTPFADVAVCAHAESLPMSAKHDPETGGTKIALRSAFADDLPPAIVRRPKASFPLPFQTWLAPLAARLPESPFASSVFHEAALHTIAQRPEELWPMAWPVLNLAMWGDRWWGDASIWQRGPDSAAA